MLGFLLDLEDLGDIFPLKVGPSPKYSKLEPRRELAPFILTAMRA
jgi:hypothetical protein